MCVTVSKDGVKLTGRYDHALRGIESDCTGYLEEVAGELAEEAVDAAKAKLATLCACGGES